MSQTQLPSRLHASSVLRHPLERGWHVRAVSGPVPAEVAGRDVPATVPGVVHTDLLRAGLIEDPFDGANEAAQQWIGDCVWCFTTTFDWRPDDSARHDLVAEGLDTVATVTLNGQLVAKTENQHRSYRFDIRDHLQVGANVLEVEFAAPVPESDRRAEEHGRRPREMHHEFNQLRKSASNFGWDWGIDVATSGIWRPISIESWSGVRIASLRPLVDVVGADGALSAVVTIERDGASSRDVEVEVSVGSRTGVGVIASTATECMVLVTVPDVRLWWPRGHGEQPLYDVVVTAGGDRVQSRVGFRTVALDTAPDEAGRPFHLTVNGRVVQVRGVNWIPDHAFLTEVDADRLQARFADMVEGNVNLVRVWGGGIYESEAFYSLADRLGVLVWQDFLFACAAYSEGPELAGEVEAEAREHITRLSSHPSLVLWNGCNENVWAFADWGWAHHLQGRSWGAGYYEELLPRLVTELDPTRPYSPASPYSFATHLHPNDPRNGTTHIWDVWNQKDYRHYRDVTPRFVSEFGFQGPPAWSTLTRVVHDEPLDPFGKQMLVHQKAALGNDKLERGAAGHLPAWRTVEDWHWATQLNQAHAIRFGIEHFRSLAPHNTGAILWQLNDDWPVVSWAAVDFYGHRKPLWFAMRDVFAPRLATLQPRASAKAVSAAFPGVAAEEDVIALIVLNDTDDPVEDEVTALRMRLDGSELERWSTSISVAPRSQTRVDLPAAVSTWGDARGEVLVVTPAAGSFRRAVLDGAEVVDQRLLRSPLTATARRTGGGYEVLVTAQAYCRDATLQVDRVAPQASVDRGLVTLLPGESAVFTVASEAQVDPLLFCAAPVLRCANDLLHADG